MLTIFTFFTTCVGALSCVALGYITRKYDTTADATCDVTELDTSYNLYYLLMFMLGLAIATSFMMLVTYFMTLSESKSICRNIMFFILFFLYAAAIVGALGMANKFRTDHSCFTFYKENNRCMTITYVILTAVYCFQIMYVFFAMLSSLFCCCNSDDDPNESYA